MRHLSLSKPTCSSIVLFVGINVLALLSPSELASPNLKVPPFRYVNYHRNQLAAELYYQLEASWRILDPSRYVP